MDEKPITTDEKRYNDEKTGQFKEGNPGRPEGTKNKFSMATLEEAMELDEKEATDNDDVGIFRKFIKMARVNPTVMIALMRKFVPDKEKIEHDIPEGRKITIEHIGNNKQLQGKSN